MDATEMLSRFQGARRSGDGWIAKCPAHEDRSPSLSIAEATDGKILLRCHAGCTVDSICAAIQIKPADLFPDKPARNGNGAARGKIVASYDYRSEGGALLFQVCRLEPKDFRQRRPDATAPGGWSWKTSGVRRVLYRLPEILRAVKRNLPILVVEGEKDADALAALGFSATCNAGGAGKWRRDYNETLRGATVFVIADKDAPGHKHGDLVAASLHGIAARVAVLELPDRAGRAVKDAADFIAAGGDAAEFQALFDAAAEWQPQTGQGVVANTAPDFATITADVRGEILAVVTDANCKGSARNRAVATLVVDALAKVGRLYFHAERKDFDSAMFFDLTAKRLLRIRSDAFVAWLSNWLGINRADPLFKAAIAEVETAALSGAQSTAILPEAFWAARPGAIYLSNGDGSVAKITADGVALADNGTDGVLFAAGRTLAVWKLTEPRSVFETCRLFRDAHCTATHGKFLTLLWLYSLPSNPASKPPMVHPGAVGSGKTRTAKGYAEFFGIPFVAAKVEDEAESNFWPSIDQGGIFTLDNADTKCRWLADALANAATDGCSQRRRLYTNSETVTLRARAWLCVTTANPTFAADSGLADRLLVVRMDRRDGEETRDSALGEEILAARDAGLSHVAQTLCGALADTSPVPPGLNKRHPDFAAFAVRIARALGREAEGIAALQAAEHDKAAFCLENDGIGAALLAYLATAHTFTGTAAELLPHLIEVDGELRDKFSAKRLGKRLAALWPHLQSALAVARRETNRNGVQVLTLKASDAGFAGFEMAFP